MKRLSISPRYFSTNPLFSTLRCNLEITYRSLERMNESLYFDRPPWNPLTLM